MRLLNGSKGLIAAVAVAAVERLRERGNAVFAYFSNFYEGHAPASANKLKRLLGQATVGPDDLENQPSLF